jgi:hypothetical protein
MGDKSGIVWILTLLLLGALGVLVIMNASSASSVFGTIFTGFNSWAQTLSGAGYKNAGYTSSGGKLKT